MWAFGGAVLITLAVFLVLPLTQMISSKVRGEMDIMKAPSVVQPPPPPVFEDEAPPPEPEAPEEIKPQLEPQTQHLSLDQLDLDIGSGGGGFLGTAFQGFQEAASGLEDLSLFNLSDLDKSPVLVASPSPQYPRELRKSRVEGSVVLVFVLNEEGRVEDPRVQSASHPEFEKPALVAVRRWKFNPGMKEGKAVRTHMRLPISFKIGT